MTSDRAYLSIVQWPDGWTDEAKGNLLAHAAGLDPYDAVLAAKRGTPGVVAMLDPSQAEASLTYLRERGVMANAPLQSTMLALPRPLHIKRLFWTTVGNRQALGFDRWRGTPTQGLLNCDHLFLIVRAMTRSSERRVSTNRNSNMGGVATGFIVGGVGGAVIGGALSGIRNTPDVSSRVHTAEAMDIYTRAPTGEMQRLRITSGRFNADILAEHRGVSAKEYMQGIESLLTQSNRRALVDTGFEDFRAPTDTLQSHFRSTGSSSVQKHTDAGAFEFYSEWACLLYAAMLG